MTASLDGTGRSGLNEDPFRPARRGHTIGQVAQSVEQGTENPRVGGSIPSLATIL